MYLNYTQKMTIFEGQISLFQIYNFSLMRRTQKVVFGTFCAHNYQKSVTNEIQLKCLNDDNLIHAVSQVGYICNKCSELLTKSLQTSDHCLVCADEIKQYLKAKDLCPHDNQQYDEAAIKCRNDPKQIHYVPLKAQVCGTCLNKIHAAFNISQDCKICSGNENLIFEDIQKNMVSPILSSIKNISKYLQEQKVEDTIYKNELQYYCKAEKGPQVKSIVPKELLDQESTESHLSKRYSLYPKCKKHRNSPVQLCNKCLVGVLNLECCPYGCPYIKQKKKVRGPQNAKQSETAFLCMYPHSLENSYYLDLFVIRLVEEKGRYDRWESSMKKVRPLDEISNKFQKYFCLYSGSTYVGNKMYINCGGVLGGSISTKEPTNNSFLLRLTDDLKNFEIRETQPMNDKRASHAIVFHQSASRVYAIGGFIKGQGCLNSCECYDMNSNKWIKMADLKIERSKPTAFMYQNELYVFGGMTMNAKIHEYFAEKYNQSKNEWQLLAFEGFDYPTLTGAISLTTLPSFQNKQALWMVGGSNYQDYSTLVQNLAIEKKSFSLNVDNYLTTNRARCNSTLGLINDDIVVVFGGLKQHESLMYIEAIKLRTIKDFVQPMFVYEDIELGSYRLMLRESSDHVYQKLYEDLEEEEILNKGKLDKKDIKLTSNYNSHMLEKMFYTLGKNFVWVPIEAKK